MAEELKRDDLIEEPDQPINPPEDPPAEEDPGPSVTDSILNSVKKNLGIMSSCDSFDPDIIMNINSAISTLAQLGIGSETFYIEDASTTYRDYLGDDTDYYHSVKMYLYYKTKLGFDSSSLSSYVVETLKEQIRELEWRLMRISEDLERKKEEGEISK